MLTNVDAVISVSGLNERGSEQFYVALDACLIAIAAIISF